MLGTVLPMRHFVPWLMANDWDWMGMIALWYANGAVAGVTRDVTIAALTLVAWCLWESARSWRWIGLEAIPATFGVGLSLGLPLYLLLRRD
jgi:hypothetical protein